MENIELLGRQEDRNRKGHRWTQAELIRLMQLWDTGMHLDKMAKELQTTTHAIGKMIVRLRAQGIPLKRRTAGKAPHKRNGQLWTQDEVAYLVRRRRDKANVEEIAVELGRSWSAINGMIQNLRKRGVDVPQFGKGMRRLYDVSGLTLTYGEPEGLIQ